MKIFEQGFFKPRQVKTYVDQEASVHWNASEGALELWTMNNSNLYYPKKRLFNCWARLSLAELQQILNTGLEAGIIMHEIKVIPSKSKSRK